MSEACKIIGVVIGGIYCGAALAGWPGACIGFAFAVLLEIWPRNDASRPVKSGSAADVSASQDRLARLQTIEVDATYDSQLDGPEIVNAAVVRPRDAIPGGVSLIIASLLTFASLGVAEESAEHDHSAGPVGTALEELHGLRENFREGGGLIRGEWQSVKSEAASVREWIREEIQAAKDEAAAIRNDLRWLVRGVLLAAALMVAGWIWKNVWLPLRGVRVP